jgi:hypothetical protein
MDFHCSCNFHDCFDCNFGSKSVATPLRGLQKWLWKSKLITAAAPAAKSASKPALSVF